MKLGVYFWALINPCNNEVIVGDSGIPLIHESHEILRSCRNTHEIRAATHGSSLRISHAAWKKIQPTAVILQAVGA